MFNLIKLEWKKSSSFRFVAMILIAFLTLSLIGQEKLDDYFLSIFIFIFSLCGLIFLGVITNLKDDLDNPAPMNFILPFNGSQILIAKIFILFINISLFFITFMVISLLTSGNLFNISIKSITLNDISDMFINFVSIFIAFVFYTTSLYASMLFIKTRYQHTKLFKWFALWLIVIFLSSIFLVKLNTLLPYVFSFKFGIHKLLVKPDYFGSFLIDGLSTTRLINVHLYLWIKELYVVSTFVFIALSFICFKIGAHLIDKKLDL